MGVVVLVVRVGTAGGTGVRVRREGVRLVVRVVGVRVVVGGVRLRLRGRGAANTGADAPRVVEVDKRRIATEGVDAVEGDIAELRTETETHKDAGNGDRVVGTRAPRDSYVLCSLTEDLVCLKTRLWYWRNRSRSVPLMLRLYGSARLASIIED